MKRLPGLWVAGGFIVLASCVLHAEQFVWRDSGPGLAVASITNEGPVLYTVVRVDRSRFQKDLALTTTLGSNTVVGLETLTGQLAALPPELGTPVAAINADFFMMAGAAKGDPRGLQILRGELVSAPTGPAAFWQDARGNFHAQPVSSRLTVSWRDGEAHRAGLNEQMGTNSVVLFTPRMGTLYPYPPKSSRPSTNSVGTGLTRSIGTRTNTVRTNPVRTSTSSRRGTNGPPQPGPIRPPGGREYVLARHDSSPWLPLKLGHTCQAVVRASMDGFTNVEPDTMVLSLSSNLLQKVPELTIGTIVTIHAATEPDLTGIQSALGTGPMLVVDGKVQQVSGYMTEALHPRSALGWDDTYLYMAVADGRQPGLSIGIPLASMADFMGQLGCAKAINLDGGLSTVLMLNGKIVNHPSMGAKADKPGRERDIANAVVILRKPPEDRED